MLCGVRHSSLVFSFLHNLELGFLLKSQPRLPPLRPSLSSHSPFDLSPSGRRRPLSFRPASDRPRPLYFILSPVTLTSHGLVLSRAPLPPTGCVRLQLTWATSGYFHLVLCGKNSKCGLLLLEKVNFCCFLFQISRFAATFRLSVLRTPKCYFICYSSVHISWVLADLLFLFLCFEFQPPAHMFCCSGMLFFSPVACFFVWHAVVVQNLD